jgi:hypothetical protein
LTLSASVYSGSSPGALITALTESKDRTWHHQLNDTGSGAVKIHILDTDLAAHPTLKNYGNIIRCQLDGIDRFAFIIESRDLPPAPVDEHAGQWWTLSGRGVLGILANAIVYPEVPITWTSPRDRTFGYMALAYDDSAWTAAVQLQQQGDLSGYIPNYHGIPSGWPDPSAWWISSQATTGSDPNIVNPVGTSYFRKSFTMATGGSYAIFATVDNQFRMWLDDELLIDNLSQGHLGYINLQRVDKPLAAGNHTIAIEAVNTAFPTGNNPMGVLVSIIQLDHSGKLTSTVLLHTDNTWLADDYPATPPGMSPGTIMRLLVQEAQARGALTGVTLSFTDSLDSNGHAWTEIPDIAFPLGMPLLEIARTLVEGFVDVSMTPTLVLNLYKKYQLGSDLSGSVTLAVGTDFEELSVNGNTHLCNVVLARDQFGELIEQTDAASLASQIRKETYIEYSTAPSASAARTLALKLFKDVSLPTGQVRAKVVQSSGPYTTWNPGDSITVPGLTGNVEMTVMAITVSEDDAGHPIIEVEGALYD